MFRNVAAFAALLVACGAVRAEDAHEASVEEKIVVSSAILTAKVGEDAGTFKEGNVEYKKVGVVIQKVLRQPDQATALKEGATVTVWATSPPKKDEERILFLGRPNGNGYPLRGTAEAGEAGRVAELLALEAKADKELDGKERLRAAFFHAHKLRPVLLARAEGKSVKQEGGVDAGDRDKLLDILGWALRESVKKDAADDLKDLAEALRDVLSGAGGLPDIRTRRERLTQFLGEQLNTAEQRKRYDLTKLSLTDAPAAAERPAAAQQAGVRQQVLVLGPGVVRVAPTVPTTRPGPQPEPEPEPPKPPPASSLGKAVNGLALRIRADRAVCTLTTVHDQRLHLTVAFENVSSKALRLNTYLIDSLLAQVFITDAAGKSTAYSDKGRLAAVEVPAMGPWSFKELKPREAMEIVFDVPVALLNRPGDYRLCVEYENPYGRQFGIADAWTGKVASPNIDLKVVRQEATPSVPERKPEPAAPAPVPAPQPMPSPAPVPDVMKPATR